MRPSQMGSKWTASSATKKNSGIMEKELREMPQWPGSHGGAAMSPPPRYMDDNAADMMFPPNVRSPSSGSPVQPRGPPVPPKDYKASPTRNWDRRKHGQGIPKEWDVEKGVGEENDRQPLSPRRDYNAKW